MTTTTDQLTTINPLTHKPTGEARSPHIVVVLKEFQADIYPILDDPLVKDFREMATHMADHSPETQLLTVALRALISALDAARRAYRAGFTAEQQRGRG